MENYTLEPITIVAGNFFTLEFEVFDKGRDEMADLLGYEAFCLISPFAQNEATIIQQKGVITQDGVFTVTIQSEDTINLTGKFVYQPVLRAINGRQYRPAQGVLTILPANVEIY